jgi:hypothetical protein
MASVAFFVYTAVRTASSRKQWRGCLFCLDCQRCHLSYTLLIRRRQLHAGALLFAAATASGFLGGSCGWMRLLIGAGLAMGPTNQLAQHARPLQGDGASTQKERVGSRAGGKKMLG